MAQNMWGDITRNFSAFLDMNVVYPLISLMYDTFQKIAQLTIIDNDIINELASRLYVLLGVIMLFKVTFSLIQMFVNPDNIKGEKGAGKLIQKIIIMLILLVSVPTIFQTAYSIQSTILKEDIIGKIILGNAGSISQNPGDNMATNVFKGFFRPRPANFNCPGSDATYNAWCEMESLDQFDDSWVSAADSKVYKFEYSSFISTVAGGFTAWIIMMFCFDVAIRSVKLSFLQLIAPIPIISSIDPKGQKTFDNWVQNCIKTYLDVFMRIMIIDFVVFIISRITAGSGMFNFYDVVTGEKKSVGFFIGAWVIIGLLLFAKEAPQLIGDLFGIKLSGKFTMNPFKRLGEAPLVGGLSKRAGNIVGAGGSLIGNAMKMPFGAAWDKIRRNDVKTGLEARKDAMFAEARGRARSTGDKYSGDTYGGILAKERETTARNRTIGRKEIADRENMYNEGKKYGGKSSNEVFKNPKFIKSFDDMDREKKAMYAAQNKAQAVQAALSRGEATEADLAAANRASGTAQSRYEIAKATHESNRKIYGDDARRQDAKDYYEKTEVKATSTTSTTTNSNYTSDQTVNVGGVQASVVSNGQTATTSSGAKVNPGEAYTASGIILPSSSINSRKNGNNQ